MVGTPLNYCPSCGGALTKKEIEGRSRAYCPACETPIYRNPKPCAGILVVDTDDRILLVKRTQPPAVGSWSVPAGYLEVDEPPRVAATRELREETGLEIEPPALVLLDTAFVRHPDGQFVLVVVYTARRSQAAGTVTAGSDAAAARFWDLDVLTAGAESLEAGYEDMLRDAVQSVEKE